MRLYLTKKSFIFIRFGLTHVTPTTNRASAMSRTCDCNSVQQHSTIHDSCCSSPINSAVNPHLLDLNAVNISYLCASGRLFRAYMFSEYCNTIAMDCFAFIDCGKSGNLFGAYQWPSKLRPRNSREQTEFSAPVCRLETTQK